jgi:RND family efflux transporter MFP subunit
MLSQRSLALITLGGLVLVGALLVPRLRAAPEVDTTTVVRHVPANDLLQLSASGYAVPFRKASLSAKITGRLAWIGVREGSVVVAGDLVARLDDAEYRAAVDQGAATIDLLQSRLAQAQASADESRLQQRRTRELFASHFVSASVLDSAEAKTRIAEAAVAAAEAEIRVAAATLRNSRIALEQTRIVAPFDGIVVAQNANVGDIVTPFSASLETKGAVLTVADPRSLEIRLDIAESQHGRLRPGQPCLIRLDTAPDVRLTGSVARVVPAVDRARGTFPVLVRFDAAPAGSLLPDMSAKVDFLERAPTAAELEPVVVVDADALVTDDGRSFAYKLAGDRVLRVPLERRRTFGRRVEIAGELGPGDVVVRAPPAGLADGDSVRVRR